MLLENLNREIYLVHGLEDSVLLQCHSTHKLIYNFKANLIKISADFSEENDKMFLKLIQKIKSKMAKAKF